MKQEEAEEKLAQFRQQLAKLRVALIDVSNAAHYASSLASELEYAELIPGRVQSYLAACDGHIEEADDDYTEAESALGDHEAYQALMAKG